MYSEPDGISQIIKVALYNWTITERGGEYRKLQISMFFCTFVTFMQQYFNLLQPSFSLRP